FFAGAEIALGTSSRARLRQRAQAGAWGAQIAERLLGRPQILLSTTLLGVNAASVVAAVTVALYLEAHGASAMWAAASVLLPMLVLGQVVPKSLMQAHADRVAPWIAPPLAAMTWLARPLVLVVSGFAGAMTRLAGTDRKKAFVTRDELAMLI